MSTNEPAREKPRRPGLPRERMRTVPDAGRRRTRPWRFQIGRVVGKSLSLWFANLPQFLLLTTTVFAPYIVLQYWGNIVDPSMQFSLWWTFGDLFLQQLLGAMVSATVIYGVFQKLRGRSPGFGAAVAHGISRVPAVVLVVLCMALCYAAIVVPMAMLLLAAPSAYPFVMLVGGIAFMIVQCGLFVAVATCVVEKTGNFKALSRSWRLTRGFKGQIFVILLAVGIITWLLSLVIIGPAALILGEASVWVILVAITVLMVSIQAVVAAVTYHDLRVAKEGVDTEQLAAIFD